MLLNKLLCLRADMNFMIIPDKYKLPSNQTKQSFQKSNRMRGAKTTLIRTSRQSQTPHFGADQECAKHVQALMMVQPGTCRGRLSTRRPTAFEWRHQREAAFIYKHQRRLQLAPLFLSLARLDDANRQLLRRCVEWPAAVPSGNSNPGDPADATHHWPCNGL